MTVSVSAHDHLVELVAAAEDLGFGVVEVSLSKVVLLRIHDHVEITVAGVFVSGAVLREVLLAQPRRQP